MRMYEDDYYNDEPTIIEQLIEEKRRKGLLPKTSYTKEEVIAKLQDIRARAWYHHSRFDDDKDFEVDRAIEDIVSLIDIEIGKLKENKYDR